MTAAAARPAPPRPAAPPAPPGTWRLAHRDRSLLVDRRAATAAAVLAVLVAATVAVGLALGTASVPLNRTLPAAFGVGEARDVLLVQQLRLPRIAAGLAVGAALGVSGVLLQTLARNRLATPDTVGLNDGATAFATASVVAVSTSITPSAFALVGSATAAALALGLAGGAGRRGYRFLVVGLGVGAALGAVTQLMLARAPIDEANQAFPWSVGSLNSRSATSVTVLAVGLAVALPVAVVLGRRLRLLRLADAVVTGLGSRVARVRLAVIGTAVVTAGLAVATAGPLGLVALLAPEIARKAAGPRVVPVVGAALAGALVVLLADLLGRTVAAPLELPAGLVTAVVGGPYLLWLLLTTRTRRMP
ncbi:iron complex transport system permease protein [Geodermatophilus amargosae]|uniref:Iron complex transport system permease protein n=1 Tax=Geodermatophilus amargosae TaxID=1296565 RepID=A0A1I7CJB9_9ACTN|nr:iron ABC transporter permease [Geodermatophilus amargosae]SFT99516.1 iron complex transport system permease protein [Geodermatophilus amargosae]